MKKSNFLVKGLGALAFMAALASCASKASVEGTIAGASDAQVVVKLLDVNRYTVLDTIKTDAKGKFAYSIEVEEGMPEFVYLFYKNNKVASLLLEKGDKVAVETDTLGRNCVLSGSEESAKLLQVEKDLALTAAKLDKLSDKLIATKDQKEAKAISSEITKEYISYYRSRVQYVMENSKSLTSIPVLYQSFSSELPVFGQLTDALHFDMVCDSLETVYPASRYVKALRKEAQTRMNELNLSAKIQEAPQIGFPDIELPDIKGEKVKLSEVDAKVVMIHFWTAADATQKMFNLDVLKPVYDEFHKKGFEIYQVSLDVDKGLWARVVKEQALPWINVCDSRGAASPYAGAYNIPAVPATFILANGELVDGKVVDEKSLRKLIKGLL